MAYESYKEVHKFTGIVLTAPVPTTAGDMTTVPPINGEIRADTTNLYVATAVTSTTVVWKKVVLAAFA